MLNYISICQAIGTRHCFASWHNPSFLIYDVLENRNITTTLILQWITPPPPSGSVDFFFLYSKQYAIYSVYPLTREAICDTILCLHHKSPSLLLIAIMTLHRGVGRGRAYCAFPSAVAKETNPTQGDEWLVTDCVGENYLRRFKGQPMLFYSATQGDVCSPIEWVVLANDFWSFSESQPVIVHHTGFLDLTILVCVWFTSIQLSISFSLQSLL